MHCIWSPQHDDQKPATLAKARFSRLALDGRGDVHCLTVFRDRTASEIDAALPQDIHYIVIGEHRIRAFLHDQGADLVAHRLGRMTVAAFDGTDGDA